MRKGGGREEPASGMPGGIPNLRGVDVGAAEVKSNGKKEERERGGESLVLLLCKKNV